jgi:hypothetical protein
MYKFIPSSRHNAKPLLGAGVSLCCDGIILRLYLVVRWLGGPFSIYLLLKTVTSFLSSEYKTKVRKVNTTVAGTTF